MCLSNEIISLYKSGKLIDEVVNLTNKFSHKEVDGAISNLHNESKINITEAILSTVFVLDDESNPGLRYRISNLLVLLEVELQEFLDAISHISSNSPYNYHRFYSNKYKGNIDAHKALLKLIVNNEQYLDFLYYALVDGFDIDRDFFSKKADELLKEKKYQLIVINAFSGIHLESYKDKDIIQKITSLIRDNIINTNEIATLRAIFAFSIKVQTDTGLHYEELCNIQISLLKKEISFHEMIGLFTYYLKQLHNAVLQRFLDFINDNINSLDYSESVISLINELFEINKTDTAIDLLESLLRNDTLEYDFAHLKILKTHIVNKALVNFLVTKWMSSGEPILCRFLHDIIDNSNASFIGSIDVSVLSTLTEKQIKVLSLRLIGWLHINLKFLLTFFVSIIENVDQSLKEGLEVLFIELVIEDYPYVIEELANDTGLINASSTLLKFKDEVKVIMDRIRNTTEIQELKPSDFERQLFHKLKWDKEQKMLDEANKSSLLSLLCTTNVLMLGTECVLIKDFEHKTQKVEMKLNPIGASIHLPRSFILDPIGFEIQSFNLRFGDPL